MYDGGGPASVEESTWVIGEVSKREEPVAPLLFSDRVASQLNALLRFLLPRRGHRSRKISAPGTLRK